MGRKANIFILIPLVAFGTIIFGFGMYNTLCKNVNIPLPC